MCAQCRRVLSLDTQRVFACRACVRVLYCTTACARTHNEEHRPVCIKHENWADDAPQATGAGAQITVVDLSEEEAPQVAAERAKREAAALAEKNVASLAEEHERLLQRISELERERAANSGPKVPKRKRGEDANARERGTKVAKGGKGQGQKRQRHRKGVLWLPVHGASPIACLLSRC